MPDGGALVSSVTNVSKDVNGNGVKLELVRHTDANGVSRSLPGGQLPHRPTRTAGLNLDLRRSHGSGRVEGSGGLYLPGLLERSAGTHRPADRLDAVMRSSARGVEGVMTWTREPLARVAAGLTRSWSGHP